MYKTCTNYTSIFTIPVKQQLTDTWPSTSQNIIDDEWDVKLYYTVPIIDEAVDQWRKWLYAYKKAKGHPSI